MTRMTSPAHAHNDDALEIDTRSLYLQDDLPMIYLAPGTDMAAELADFFVPAAQRFGLPPFNAAEVIARGGVNLGHAAEGWHITFEYDKAEPFPELTIHWPASCAPLLFGTRVRTPPQWSGDAILFGRAVVMLGPRLDWETMAVTLDDSSLVPTKAIMQALTGRPAAAGIMHVSVRPLSPEHELGRGKSAGPV